MLNQSAFSTGVAPTLTMMQTIKSRFGDIVVDTDKAVLFPRGLLGIPDKSQFMLASFPSPKMQQFMLLQSLEDPNLSFITLPLDFNNSMIEADDLRAACRDLQIEESDVAILLIVLVHRGLDQVRLSVNLRAPILVDAKRRKGSQYVFIQDHYKVQHML